MNKLFLYSSLILSTSVNSLAFATSSLTKTDSVEVMPSALVSLATTSLERGQSTVIADSNENQAKQNLKQKLNKLMFFSAEFTQKILMESGEILQESKGFLALKKPNSLYWETYEPDELYIISKDDDVWFYNPWIEEASVYNASIAAAQTPLLLLTNTDDVLWQQYNVVEQVTTVTSETTFVISSKNSDSQIKALTLTFKMNEQGETLSTFAFLDATGQTSLITLSKFNSNTQPDNTLFNFKLPEGVDIKDHRNN
jgi:outer membrane lipoprotein carrier protein